MYGFSQSGYSSTTSRSGSNFAEGLKKEGYHAAAVNNVLKIMICPPELASKKKELFTVIHRHPEYSDEAARVGTFRNDRAKELAHGGSIPITPRASWPHKNSGTISANNMARAGFWHEGFYHKDAAICFQCDNKLVDFRDGEDPVQEHIKYFPNCDYIKSLDMGLFSGDYKLNEEKCKMDNEKLRIFETESKIRFSPYEEIYLESSLVSKNAHGIKCSEFRCDRPAVTKYYPCGHEFCREHLLQAAQASRPKKTSDNASKASENAFSPEEHKQGDGDASIVDSSHSKVLQCLKGCGEVEYIFTSSPLRAQLKKEGESLKRHDHIYGLPRNPR